MSLIHVPIHLYRIELNCSQCFYYIYIIFYKIDILHRKIENIVKNGGKIDNIDKLLIGIVNSYFV